MLRLGRLVWRQTRDMSVWNYSQVMVYEIFTNQGSLYVRQNKMTGKIDVVDVNNKVISGVQEKLDEQKQMLK
jgi:hypothetical protein